MPVKRPRHPKKMIENAIQDAETRGWRYQASGKSSHAWGRLLCSLAAREGCKMSIWSTPRNAEDHAQQIRARVSACQHCNLV